MQQLVLWQNWNQLMVLVTQMFAYTKPCNVKNYSNSPLNGWAVLAARFQERYPLALYERTI